MKNNTFYRIGFVVLLLVGFSLAFNSMNKPEAETGTNNVLTLQAPSFLGNPVLAAPLAQTGTSFLDDEAGVSAYTRINSGSINLTQVRDAFRTIEYETSSYIIGSVALTDYEETQDVHVYVNTSGWVIAYYRAEEPASKIIDLLHYDGVTISTTKLEMAMDKILVEVGVVSYTASYYDFRYPNATRLMLIAEKHNGTDNRSFDLLIPDTFVMYERSWAHCDRALSTSYLYLDDVEISEFNNDNHSYSGILTLAQLSPTTYHTFTISQLNYNNDGNYTGSTAGVALVYNEGS